MKAFHRGRRRDKNVESYNKSCENLSGRKNKVVISFDRSLLRVFNRPFAQLLPGLVLETGHPVTVGQSPAYDFSVSDEEKAVFLVSFSDCSLCDSYAGD